MLYLKKADLTGQVLVNGLPKEERDFKRCTAYVMQDDALYAFLTVRSVNYVLTHNRLMAKRWIRVLTHKHRTRKQLGRTFLSEPAWRQ